MSHFPRPKSRPVVEGLEGRSLLTGGAGSTFALVPATVATAGGTAAQTFTINQNQFTGSGGKITLGIDVAANSGSKLSPKIVSVLGPDHKPLHLTHSNYSPQIARSEGQSSTRGVLVTLPVGATPSTYTVVVAGQKKTSGVGMLGFYLPGDSNGDGVVDSTDIQAIKTAMGSKTGGANYDFEADANRDGRIDRADLKLAQQDLGAKTTIEPLISSNIDPDSISTYQQRTTNVQTIHLTGNASAGATITYQDIADKMPAVTSTADASNKYGIFLTLSQGSNTYKVTSTDSFGQSITGTIDPIVYNPSLPSLSQLAAGLSSAPTTTTDPTK